MKTMKKFAALMMLLCALMICTIPALAANESGSDSNVTETVSVTAGSNDNDVTSAKAMGSGVMIGIACLGGALAMGHVDVGGGEGAVVAGVVGVGRGAYFEQLAVEVDDVRGAGALVEVVDVLRDDGDVVVLLKLGQRQVGGVGLRGEELAPQGVVEVGDEVGVGLPALGGGYCLDGVTLPKAVAVAKGAETALGADAGACEHNEFLLHGVDAIYK